jgi:hypothetical protein
VQAGVVQEQQRVDQLHAGTGIGSGFLSHQITSTSAHPHDTLARDGQSGELNSAATRVIISKSAE